MCEITTSPATDSEPLRSTNDVHLYLTSPLKVVHQPRRDIGNSNAQSPQKLLNAHSFSKHFGKRRSPDTKFPPPGILLPTFKVLGTGVKLKI